MALCKSCRILFRPRGLSALKKTTADPYLKHVVHMYDTYAYRGTNERLPLCWSIVAALLDIFPSMPGSGPVWASWQLPADRRVWELGTLIHSHSHTSANLNGAVTRRIEAELISSFGKTYEPPERAAATGKKPQSEGAPRGGVVLSAGLAGNERRWTFTLLRPRW